MATEKQIKYWKKMKGRSLSKITKYRRGQSQKGHPNHLLRQTEEAKRKIGESLMGEKNYNWGKHLSLKTRQKISKKNLGRILSIETRARMSLAKQKVKHYHWKGGITPLSVKIRTSPEMKLWRETVFQRDKYTCVWCNAKNGNGHTVILNADHIKPFAQYPELRFAIDNGRTLCIDCHKKTDTYAGKIKLYDKR